MKEIWKNVPFYAGLYEVSNLGRIKSYHKDIKGIIIAKRIGKNGYIRTSLHGYGNIYTVDVHRIIAEVFVPNPNNKPCINHKDFNRVNNKADNLKWVTAKENTEYSKNNLYLKKGMKGELHPRAIFTNNQFIEMKKMRESGIRYADIARKFNAKQNTILQIFRRGCYLKS